MSVRLPVYLLPAFFFMLSCGSFAGELLRNYNFTQSSQDAPLSGWERQGSGAPGAITLFHDGNKNCISLKAPPEWGGNPNKGLGFLQDFALPPEAKQLLVRGRLRAPVVAVGGKDFEFPKAFLIFFDASGTQIGGWPCTFGFRMATPEWKDFSASQEVFAGAVRARMVVEIWNNLSSLDVDYLSVETRKPGDAVDATLPEGETLFWGREPVETLTQKRGRVCLNGLWQFSPAQTEHPPVRGWGYIRVPGAWSSVLQTMPGLIAAGIGPEWEGFPVNNRHADAAKRNRAWMRRRLSIPTEWQGRRIALDFDRICTDAEVFLSGEKVGEVRWPGGEVDITRKVRPGQEMELVLRVLARHDREEITEYTGNAANQIFQKKLVLENRGVTGDVFLTARPEKAYISDVFIQPSTRRKLLKLSLELRGISGGGMAQIEAVCVNEKGIAEKTHVETFTLATGGMQTRDISIPWDNPRLWDFQQPNLYTLRLKVVGSGIHDELAQTFGFREFWIEGRNFMLNGTQIRFRPRNCAINENDREITSIERMDGIIDGMMSLGGNLQEFWPWDHFLRGTTRMIDLWCERADLKGWPVIAPLGSMRQFCDRWNRSTAEREEWLRLMEREVRRLRNHPSILMWIHSPNRLGLHDDQNPQVLGNRNMLTPTGSEGYLRALHGAQAANEAIRALDPTRPVTLHQGGAAGDFHSINNYLSWIPLQEQEEWLSGYMQNGDLPYLPVEFGFFPPCDYRRGRNAWAGSVTSESLMTEYIASYLGDRAFREETPLMRAFNPANFISGQQYKRGNLPDNPLSDEIIRLMGRNVYLSWRTIGAPGGMLQWELQWGWAKPDKGRKTEPLRVAGPFLPGRRGTYAPTLTPYELYYISEKSLNLRMGGEYLKTSFAPVAAWIVGREVPGDVADFTAKDHHFIAGDAVKKRIAILNDTRAEADFYAQWEVLAQGRVIATGKEQGRIAPAKTIFLPLEFTAPETALLKEEAQIRLRATVAGQEQEDGFSLQIYGKPAPIQSTLAIFDPLGQSRKMLGQMGYLLQEWDGKPTVLPLVIGREAFSSGVSLPGNLSAFVRAGGRAIVLQQRPDWLSAKAGFRVGAQVVRRVFPVVGGHALNVGLDAEDLRDWSGMSTLCPLPDLRKNRGGTQYGWRWSNRGGVCSAPVEKPHTGGWRPLLQCDFGSLYSPLLLLKHGKGELILCQLDLEDHALLDPAAGLICRRILNSNAEPVNAEGGTTAYIGELQRGEMLQKMGVVLDVVKAIPQNCRLLILGPGAAITDKQAQEFCERGGMVLALSGAKTGLKTEQKVGYCGAAEVPDWPECAGLTVSDLHIRAPLDMALYQAADGVQTGANGLLARRMIGKGVMIGCQLDPDLYQADTKTYFRITRWRAYRVMAQLLTNLGAKFSVNERFFTFEGAHSAERGLLNLRGEWLAKQTLRLERPGTENAKADDPGISAAALAAIRGGTLDGAMRVSLPGELERFGAAWTDFDGEAVLQKAVTIPEEWAGKDLSLLLGIVDDFDNTFFNGEEIGRTGAEQSGWWTHERRYVIPGKLVRAGVNVLSVRLFDNFMQGGIFGSGGAIILQPNRADNLFCDWYSGDYRSDYALGDDPHRYYRW